MNYRTDLILGEALCIFFHFPVSGLAVLTSLHFYTFSPPRETYPKHSVGAEGAFDLRSILPALHNHWLLLVFFFLWSFCGRCTTHWQRSEAFLSVRCYWPIKTSRSFIQSQFQKVQKTKDCALSGGFQHKLQHCYFYLWCLPSFITSLLY